MITSKNIYLPELSEIALLRRRLGITQHELAKALGVTQSYIAKIEKGAISPSYERVREIFNYLLNLEQGVMNSDKGLDIPLKNIHVTNLVCVHPKDKVLDAVELMWRHGYSQLPVKEGDKYIGSISESTILMKIAKAGRAREIYLSNVEEHMDEAFPIVSEDTPIKSVLSLFEYTSAILTSRKGKVVGIVTKADIINHLKNSK